MDFFNSNTPQPTRNTYRVLMACIALVSMVLGLVLELGGESVARVFADDNGIKPEITLNVPGETFIGTNVTFEVEFNNDASDEGYGPIIDLIIPTNGADGNIDPDPENFEVRDGLFFDSATYLNQSVDLEEIMFPFPDPGEDSCIDHPYFVDETNTPVVVCGDAGDTFVSLRLPFGSFTPGQPEAVVRVTTSMSNFADLGVPLTIQARGGYQFGEDPLNNPANDNPAATISEWVEASVTPTLFTLSKSYNGPEDETATGPNFPRTYTVTATIAPGQTMTKFFLEDELPINMQFIRVITPGAGDCSSLPSTTEPGGTLTCEFGEVSGTVEMEFEFFIPLRDADDDFVIDPDTAESVISCNNALGGR